MHPAVERVRHTRAGTIPLSARADSSAGLTHLLTWMAGQEFSSVVSSGLLKDVESIVIESHRVLYQSQGRAWSPPVAYRWLRYEDPDPIKRLSDGARELLRMGAEPDSSAVEKACAKARKSGFLN